MIKEMGDVVKGKMLQRATEDMCPICNKKLQNTKKKVRFENLFLFVCSHHETPRDIGRVKVG